MQKKQTIFSNVMQTGLGFIVVVVVSSWVRILEFFQAKEIRGFDMMGL